MITDQDITKLKKVFVTKEEFADFKLDVGEISDKVDSLDVKFERKFDMLENKMDRVLNTLDVVVGAIQDIRDDNASACIFSPVMTDKLKLLQHTWGWHFQAKQTKRT